MKPIVIALVVAASACGPATKPPIVYPGPAPAPLRTVQATIRNAAAPSAQLLIDTAERIECGLVALPDGVKRAVCSLSPDTPAPFGAHLIVTAPDRQAQTIDLVLSGEPTQSLEDVVLAPSFVALPRLVVDGQYFRLATGERWAAIETTDFNLYARFLANPSSIEPVLAQRAELGFTLLRVFFAFDVCADGNCASHEPIGRLAPREHADFFLRIPAFLQAAARHGLYVEAVAFTGRENWTSDDEMVAYWNSLISALTDQTNVIVELQNEWDNPPNAGVPLSRMQRPPPPLLASHGSGTIDNTPLQPFWSYITYHAVEPRKIIHNCWSDWADPFHVPCIVNETAKIPVADSSLAHAEDNAFCVLMVAGCAFHSPLGKHSDLFTGTTLTLARAFAQHARRLPLEFRDGFYGHRDDLEAGPAPCPCERYYEKRLPDGRTFPMPVRP